MPPREEASLEEDSYCSVTITGTECVTLPEVALTMTCAVVGVELCICAE